VWGKGEARGERGVRREKGANEEARARGTRGEARAREAAKRLCSTRGERGPEKSLL